MIKIVNTDGEHLHIFRMPRGISTKFLGKMGFMIIVKFPKNQDFTPSLENIVLEKLQVGIKLTPSLLKVKSAPSRNIILRHNSLIF